MCVVGTLLPLSLRPQGASEAARAEQAKGNAIVAAPPLDIACGITIWKASAAQHRALVTATTVSAARPAIKLAAKLSGGVISRPSEGDHTGRVVLL